MGKKMLAKLLANPFYCMTVNPIFCKPHEHMVTTEDWKKAALKLIRENGADRFLDDLIDNLSGDYIVADESKYKSEINNENS